VRTAGTVTPSSIHHNLRSPYTEQITLRSRHPPGVLGERIPTFDTADHNTRPDPIRKLLKHRERMQEGWDIRGPTHPPSPWPRRLAQRWGVLLSPSPVSSFRRNLLLVTNKDSKALVCLTWIDTKIAPTCVFVLWRLSDNALDTVASQLLAHTGASDPLAGELLVGLGNSPADLTMISSGYTWYRGSRFQGLE